MTTLLVFGSRDATIETHIARVLDVSKPDLVIHGACGLDESEPCDPAKMKGGDGIANRLALRRGIRIRAFPAEWKRLGRSAGMTRNREQYRLGRPDLAVAQITGPVGTKMSVGSAGMLRICREGLGDRPPIPVVVYRDNDVEPEPHPLIAMRHLYRATRDERLVAPGKAIKAGAPRDEVLAALAFAAEGSRWAPWIEAVRASLRGS